MSCLAADLGAHRLDRLGRRADPDQPGVLDGTGEVGVLGQEAVARVDRVRPGPAGSLDDQVAAEIGVGGRVAREPYGEVGLAHERQSGVGVGVHGHGLDAEASAGGEDAAGDLAPVGDEESLDHVRNTPYPWAPVQVVLPMTLRQIASTVRVSRGSMTPSS